MVDNGRRRHGAVPPKRLGRRPSALPIGRPCSSRSAYGQVQFRRYGSLNDWDGEKLPIRSRMQKSKSGHPGFGGVGCRWNSCFEGSHVESLRLLHNLKQPFTTPAPSSGGSRVLQATCSSSFGATRHRPNDPGGSPRVQAFRSLWRAKEGRPSNATLGPDG